MKISIILAAAFLLISATDSAWGALAEAQGPFGSNTTPVTGTTSNLWAYTNDGGATGPNAMTAQGGTPAPGAASAARPITVGAGAVRAGTFYPGPSYGANAVPKGTTQQFVSSKSSGAFAAANFLPPSFISPLNRVRADASTVAAGESAASEAVDPGSVSPGSYPYAPNVENVEVEIDQPGDYAAAEFLAEDSTATTPIYSLVAIAQDQLLSLSDLDIKFSYDVTRLTLDSGYTPSSIESTYRSRFTISGGIATYDNTSGSYPPLFSGTYLVTQSGVSFGEGAIAAASSVPEPGCGVLLLGAATGVLTHRRRRTAGSF